MTHPELTSRSRLAECPRLPQATLTSEPAGGTQPLVSICIPSYNNEDFIIATLESVLQQTYSNFEILITDDCSKDKTVAVIKKISDPRIRVIENERNLGIGRNWQKALSEATGKYVKLLCGDDILYPECLSRQVAALENPSFAGVSLAVCACDVINTRNQVVMRRRSRFGKGRVAGAQLIRKCVRWGTNFIGEPAVGLYRKNAADLSATFDFNNPYMVDMDLWAELLKRGDAFVDEVPLAGFRISSTSVSTKVGTGQAAYFRRFIRKIQSNPLYGVNRVDVFSGYFLSFHWGILRNLFINFQTLKKSRA